MNIQIGVGATTLAENGKGETVFPESLQIQTRDGKWRDLCEIVHAWEEANEIPHNEELFN